MAMQTKPGFLKQKKNKTEIRYSLDILCQDVKVIQQIIKFIVLIAFVCPEHLYCYRFRTFCCPMRQLRLFLELPRC